MKPLKTITAALLILLASACTNAPVGENTVSETTLELNNGEKWTVNKEMTPFILESESILNAYDHSNYIQLAKDLKEKNNGLIKSCTMDGKSHDELHKWLHPHMELVESLSQADSEEKANLIIEDLKKSFQTYNTYFQ